VTALAIGRLARRLSLLALLALALAFAGPASAEQDDPVAAEEVNVPSFWDPGERLQRPDAAAIGRIRFLTTDDFPPFNFRDRRGVLIGFNVDLAAAICRVLEVECLIQYRSFDTLRPGLLANEGDAIIAGLSPTDDEDELLFTRSYLKIPARFVARRDAPFDPERAESGFVGTVCGTAHQAYLGAFFNRLIVPCYRTLAEALRELQEGRIDAVFADGLRLAFWLHGAGSDDCCAFASGPYVDDRYFGRGLAIAVRPDDRRLRAALDYALREIHRRSTYEELYLRYFPVSLF
jgi:polar amino acid transport system substrate-binding protein